MSRVAIVTGAARGIGAAIAARLASDGFTVVHLNRTISGLPNEVQFELAAIGKHEAVVDEIIARFGRIDCLINNAGIASPRRGDVLDLAPETFDTVIDVNLRGTVFLTQAVAKAMLKSRAFPSLMEHQALKDNAKKQRLRAKSQFHEESFRSKPDDRQSIQFITSASALLASPERLDYCMSKAALAMFAKGLALRLAGEGIDVFEVRPGIINTAMTAGVSAKYDDLIANGLVPEGRWGQPEDIAKICAALACGALPFSTGSIIDAGGGLHIPKL